MTSLICKEVTPHENDKDKCHNNSYNYKKCTPLVTYTLPLSVYPLLYDTYSPQDDLLEIYDALSLLCQNSSHHKELETQIKTKVNSLFPLDKWFIDLIHTKGYTGLLSLFIDQEWFDMPVTSYPHFNIVNWQCASWYHHTIWMSNHKRRKMTLECHYRSSINNLALLDENKILDYVLSTFKIDPSPYMSYLVSVCKCDTLSVLHNYIEPKLLKKESVFYLATRNEEDEVIDFLRLHKQYVTIELYILSVVMNRERLSEYLQRLVPYPPFLWEKSLYTVWNSVNDNKEWTKAERVIDLTLFLYKNYNYKEESSLIVAITSAVENDRYESLKDLLDIIDIDCLPQGLKSRVTYMLMMTTDDAIDRDNTLYLN